MTRAPLLADGVLSDSLARKVAVVVAGSLLMWVAAKVQVPFYPVPMTMQTFVAVTIGMALGWRLGAATMLLYLAEGAAGLPVFAGTPERGLGLAYMMGPTGGYLIGFVVAATATGWLAERGFGRSILGTLAAFSVGLLAIYGLGLLWLGALIGWDKNVFALGAAPFMLGEVFKMALAAAVLPIATRAALKR